MSGHIIVIGAGTMGAGIAEVAAKGGYPVTLSDLDGRVLEKARARIEGSLAKAVAKGKLSEEERTATHERLSYDSGEVDYGRAGWVIEAIPEDLELKKRVLGRVSMSTEALLGSNTSSLSLTEIASMCRIPEKVIGLHFFNPPAIMRFLEIVTADQTAEYTRKMALDLARAIDHDAIVVRDVPGFATSRLGVAIGLEAIRMLEDGVASAADIDLAMSRGYRHPMGPLELTDLVGLDVRLAIAEHLERELGPRFSPPELLRQKVAAGKTGKKAGEGFYRWEDGRRLETR